MSSCFPKRTLITDILLSRYRGMGRLWVGFVYSMLEVNSNMHWEVLEGFSVL